MAIDTCDREAALLAALDGGEPDEALMAHTRTCAVCQEAIEVWTYLQMESREIARNLEEAPLRHPGLIWWRRRILDEQAAAHRLLRPIAVFQLAAGAAGLIALGALLLWEWQARAAGLSGSLLATDRPGAPDARLVLFGGALALAAFVPLAWAAVSALSLRPRTPASAVQAGPLDR